MLSRSQLILFVLFVVSLANSQEIDSRRIQFIGRDTTPITLTIGGQSYTCSRAKATFSHSKGISLHHPVSSGIESAQGLGDDWDFGALYAISIPDATIDIQCNTRYDERLGEKRWMVVTPHGRITQDFTITVPFELNVASASTSVFTPMKNGVGKTQKVDESTREWLYYMTGASPASIDRVLAIPAIDLLVENSERDSRILFASDPFYSTVFRIRDDQVELEWTFEASKIPFDKPIDRSFSQIDHCGDEEEGLNLFQQTLFMLPGPDWLHEIAMVGYDYLSDGGQGWFKDIDWLAANLPMEDRKQVCLALHGWYDILGRYTYNLQKQELDREWTAFPNAPNCDKKVFPNSVSVKMSQEEVIRRLRYAKDRGFRVVLYFADGLAICEGAKEYFSSEKILYSGGWQGPDTIGSTHIMNPLQPAVRQFFLDYMDALLTTYGEHLDGFVWDETFHADPTNYGNEYAPGYASTGMMTLTQKLTEKVRRFRADCAFLASDCIGANGWFYKAPYALMADGTYQDSHCQPDAWPYGIFPNYKNVLWSCNWNPITRFDWTEIGARRYQAPVVFTNGWNDDRGFYEMTDDVAQKFLKLFQERKLHSTRLHWLKSKTD